MSKWTEIRDNIARELHVDNVTEEIKQRVSASIVSEVLPPIEDAVNKVRRDDPGAGKRGARLVLLARCHRAADGHAGCGVAGQDGADQDARADGTGIRQSQQPRGFGFGACFFYVQKVGYRSLFAKKWKQINEDKP